MFADGHGVPWESVEGGLLHRWWATVTAASFRTRALFAADRDGVDPVAACTFSATACALVMMTACLLGLAVLVIGSGAVLSLLPRGFTGWVLRHAAAWGVAWWAGYSLLLTLLAAIAGFVAPFLIGGIHHLVLLIFSGVPRGRGYAHTVRLNAYVSGACAMWLLFPIIGPLLALVFHGVAHVSGYDALHRCGTGKAFVAWLLPSLSCCCCCATMIAAGAAVG